MLMDVPDELPGRVIWMKINLLSSPSELQGGQVGADLLCPYRISMTCRKGAN
jgi:hypothetical protein